MSASRIKKERERGNKAERDRLIDLKKWCNKTEVRLE